MRGVHRQTSFAFVPASGKTFGPSSHRSPVIPRRWIRGITVRKARRWYWRPNGTWRSTPEASGLTGQHSTLQGPLLRSWRPTRQRDRYHLQQPPQPRPPPRKRHHPTSKLLPGAHKMVNHKPLTQAVSPRRGLPPGNHPRRALAVNRLLGRTKGQGLGAPEVNRRQERPGPGYPWA